MEAQTSSPSGGGGGAPPANSTDSASQNAVPPGMDKDESQQARARSSKVEGRSIGIDLGTTYSCVGVWQHDTVEIIANEQGHKTTPSYVAFSGNDRLVGEAAKAQAAINSKNTVFVAKRLIGRKYSDKSIKADKIHWPFKIVKGPGEKPLIRVQVGLLHVSGVHCNLQQQIQLRTPSHRFSGNCPMHRSKAK